MKTRKAKTPSKKAVVSDFRPYRVLFLVVVTSVTCLVLFAALSVSIEG